MLRPSPARAVAGTTSTGSRARPRSRRPGAPAHRHRSPRQLTGSRTATSSPRSGPAPTHVRWRSAPGERRDWGAARQPMRSRTRPSLGQAPGTLFPLRARLTPRPVPHRPAAWRRVAEHRHVLRPTGLRTISTPSPHVLYRSSTAASCGQ